MVRCGASGGLDAGSNLGVASVCTTVNRQCCTQARWWVGVGGTTFVTRHVQTDHLDAETLLALLAANRRAVLLVARARKLPRQVDC